MAVSSSIEPHKCQGFFNSITIVFSCFFLALEDRFHLLQQHFSRAVFQNCDNHKHQIICFCYCISFTATLYKHLGRNPASSSSYSSQRMIDKWLTFQHTWILFGVTDVQRYQRSLFAKLDRFCVTKRLVILFILYTILPVKLITKNTWWSGFDYCYHSSNRRTLFQVILNKEMHVLKSESQWYRSQIFQINRSGWSGSGW